MNRIGSAGVVRDMRTPIVDLLRGLTAAAVMLTGVVHLDLWAQGFRDVAVVGPLFLVNAAAALGLALTVLVWRHWLPLVAAAGLGAATAGAFWLSVLHGLAGVHVTAGGAPQVLAQVGDYGAVALGLGAAVLLVRSRPVDRPADHGRSDRPLKARRAADGGDRG